MVVHTCSPSPQDVEVGGQDTQGHLQLLSGFVMSLNVFIHCYSVAVPKHHDQRHHKEERVYFGLRFYRDKNPSVTGMAAGQGLSEGGGRGGYILHLTSVVYLLQ